MELQKSLRCYCQFNGIEIEDYPNSICCEMPSGAILTIYKELRILGIYMLYGHIFFPYRQFFSRVYIDAKGADYINKKFNEQIKETIEKHNNK